MKKRLRELAAPLGWVLAGVTPGGHLRLTDRTRPGGEDDAELEPGHVASLPARPR